MCVVYSPENFGDVATQNSTMGMIIINEINVSAGDLTPAFFPPSLFAIMI
jgi:hypothetical protein